MSGNTNYPKCNLEVNGQEYYEEGLDKLGSALSVPFLISATLCACICSLIFGFVGYNTYNTTKQYTAGVVILYIIAICCLSSFFSNLYQTYKARRRLLEPPKNPNNRPCWSAKYNQLIMS